MADKKIRVAVLYGGRSGEHDVSLRSAASVIRNLDRDRFEVIPIGIDKQGCWRLQDLSKFGPDDVSMPMDVDAPQVMVLPHPSKESSIGGNLVAVSGGSSTLFHMAFPVLHGSFCEDGTLQGLLEMADVPYVGCGVLASAIGMDKDVAKRLAQAAGIPVVPWVKVDLDDWKFRRESLVQEVHDKLGFPCFVKPANAGSSVGVQKIINPARLGLAIQDTFKYDTKILIEKAIIAREIEVSVLELIDSPEGPRVSVPGEIEPTHEFYSYEAKYLDDNGARLSIPAKLRDDQTQEIQRMARETFKILGCEGMARVDFFVDRFKGTLYLNEINTIPGFTSISMYPKMWEASGLPYKELLSQLVDLALNRHKIRRKLVR